MKIQKDIKPTETIKYAYRYVCPACSNVAILSTNKMVGVKIKCQSCGKEIGTVIENFIKL